MKTNLEIVLDYINHGWSVIPIIPGEKKPLIESWIEFQRRQPTIAEATAWFTKWPDANIAIIVGRISGLVVIDIDDPIEGERSFRKYFGGVVTLTVKTPHGTHYYFKHPGDQPISNSIRAAPGLDVKADGGYVLAPPSVGYQWIKNPIVALPQQTLLLEAGLKKRVDLTEEDPILKGGRNNAMTRKVGKLLALGHSKEETFTMCKAFNIAYCKPPLSEFEIRSIVESIASREMQKQATIPPKTGEFIITKFSDIKAEKIRWIWPGVIPKGKLTLFIGDPGHGKSLLSAEIAACISSGRQFPDGTKPEAGNVLMVFCEDGAGDTVLPRLQAAGANLEKIIQLTVNGRFFKLDTDLSQLAEIIKRNDISLITIDPISAYLGNINSWKDDEVRRLLAGVGELAEKTDCAILCVMHLNKKVSSNAIDRGMGSVAFTAVARSVFLVGEHPEENDSRKILAPVKLNLIAKPKSLVFRINSNVNNVPYIEWDGESKYTSRDILIRNVTGLDENSNLEQAIRFIEDQLRNGEKSAKLIFDLGQKEGLSSGTIERAKKQLGIKSNQHNEGTFWKLPYDPKHNDFGL